MPTYEYTCETCKEDIERFITKVSERKNQQCTSCGGDLAKRIRTPAKPHWTSLAMGNSAGPEAIDRFDRMHKDKAAKEEKAIREHGSIN